ncbi:MAG: methyltransferase domain-containing protein [Planctomycetota bacterium]|nr:methyltransferase domain-containing protein [Planctomycetota bacterium]
MRGVSAPTWENYVARQFDQRVDAFPKQIAFDDPRLVAVKQAFPDWRGKRVLDLGCGSGRYWPALKRSGARLVGLDLSARSLEFASPENPRIIGSVARLPFPESSFDCLLLLELLQHLKTPELAVHEALRLLKPHGKLVIIDRNPLSLDATRPWLPSLLVKQIDQRRGLWMYPSRGPVQESWSRPGRWQKASGLLVSGWRLEHVESSEESSRKIRRLIPLARPFYCLTGTRSAIGPKLQHLSGAS